MIHLFSIKVLLFIYKVYVGNLINENVKNKSLVSYIPGIRVLSTTNKF